MTKYPPDWATISRQVKDERGWACQRCGAKHGQQHHKKGVGVTRVSVHHTGKKRHPNGFNPDPLDKYDCRPENLEVLCQECHYRAEIKIRKQNHRKHLPKPEYLRK
jgi:DNA-directed RNA polymerase subunit RPC12/RpoP